MSETVLDVKGLNCPLPVLRANRSLRSMTPRARGCACSPPTARPSPISRPIARRPATPCSPGREEAGVFSFVIRRRAEDPPPKEDGP